jgi:hypothetical protein
MLKIKTLFFIIVLLFSLSISGNSSAMILTDVILDVFNYDLYKGSQGEDVLKLQRVLNLDGDTVISCDGGVGSIGKESDYFGPATEASVIKFQNKYGISPADGYVGISTRALLNKIYRCYFISSYCTETYPIIDAVATCRERNKKIVVPKDLCESMKAGDVIKTDDIELARKSALQTNPEQGCRMVFVDLSVDGSNISSVMMGSPAKLSWESSGVTSCMMDSTAQNASGTMKVSPTASKKYTITCKSDVGDVSDSVQVKVIKNNLEITENDTEPKLEESIPPRIVSDCEIRQVSPGTWKAYSPTADKALMIKYTTWTLKSGSEVVTTGVTTLYSDKYVKSGIIEVTADQYHSQTIYCSQPAPEKIATTTPPKVNESGPNCNVFKSWWETVQSNIGRGWIWGEKGPCAWW